MLGLSLPNFSDLDPLFMKYKIQSIQNQYLKEILSLEVKHFNVVISTFVGCTYIDKSTKNRVYGLRLYPLNLSRGNIFITTDSLKELKKFIEFYLKYYNNFKYRLGDPNIIVNEINDEVYQLIQINKANNYEEGEIIYESDS